MRLLSILFTLLVSLSAAVPAAAETVRDVIYTEGPGIDPGDVRADVYIPDGAKNAPVVIMVHGGAWTYGNKQSAIGEFQSAFFNKQGFIYIAINYRLAPSHPFPAQIEDAAAAIAYFHEHVAEYGGDPDKIFLMGHSAGGHIAALVAIDPQYLEAEGLSTDVIKGVVPLDSAAYNLAYTGRKGSIPRFYRPAFGDDPDVWAKASPTLQVEEETPIAPFLLLYVDRAVSPRRAKELADTLVTYGHEATAKLVKKRSHKTLNRKLGAKGDKVGPMIVDFFEDQLDQ